MTRYFLDTEFIDTGEIIDLISIGIVREDGREYYAQSCEFDHREASDWVKTNVLLELLMCPQSEPGQKGIHGLFRADRAYHRKYHGQCVDQQRGRIHNCPWRSREQLHREVEAFITEPTEIWGWCSAYDFVALCQLFGTMMDLPQDWPHYIRDLQYLLDERGIKDEELPPQEGTAHNALEDAKHIKRLWEKQYPKIDLSIDPFGGITTFIGPSSEE